MKSSNLIRDIYKRTVILSFIFLLILSLNPLPADAVDGYTINYSHNSSGSMNQQAVDSTPDTFITAHPLGLTKSTDASFSCISTKDNATFECKIDNEDYTACPSPMNYAGLSDNLHNFYVRAKDTNGWSDPTPAEFEWVIDTASPSSVITPPITSIVMALAYTITGTVSDIGSSVSKVEIKISKGTWATSWITVTGTTSWSYEWSLPLVDGIYTIESRATDIAGNEQSPPATINITAYRRTPSDVTITTDGNNKQLLINNNPFTIQGVVYSPVPIGKDPTTAPYGDYFTFTTTNTGIYNRDLPLLSAMGANTVRLWTWDNTANHINFLDTAYANGIYVIAGFHINPGLDITPGSQDRIDLINDFRDMVAIHKNHPAILMWAIGNELNSSFMYGNDPDNLFSLIDEMAVVAHQEDPKHPVTTPLADEYLIDIISAYDDISLDVWGANIYRGDSFWPLFSEYSTASSKPLLITEFGIDAYNNTNKTEDQTTQSDYAGSLWNEISANSATAIGGVYKEYSDQLWAGSQSVDMGCPESDNFITQGDCGTVAPSFPDSYDNFEWWGLMSIAEDVGNPDIVSARDAYYTLQSLWKEDCVLTVLKAGTGSGTVSGGGTYDCGILQSITAVADTGSTFDGWSEDDCIGGQVIMSSNKTCTAIFSLLPGVAVSDNWFNIHSSSPNDTSGTITTETFNVTSGTQRLLLVSVVIKLDSNEIPTVSAKYGGAPLTSINMATNDNNKEVVWMGYLKEEDISSGSKPITITYDSGSDKVIGLHVKRASYTGVDQTTPIRSSWAMNNRGKTVTFGSTINYVTNGMTVVVSGNQGSPATATLSASPAFTAGTVTQTDGHSSMVFTTTDQHDDDWSYASNTEVIWSGSTGHSGLVAVSLKP